MAISQKTYVERVVITFNEDGSVRGAHQESVVVVKDGETVLASTQQSAVPVSSESISTLLPDQAALIAQVQSLTAELATLRAGA